MTKITEPLYKYQHIMLIDDSELDNFINERILQSAHFARNIYVHTSGRSALEFMNNLKTLGEGFTGANPEVIFVDLNMPFMDGFQFISQFRKTYGATTSPRLVILTSSVNEDDKNKTHGLDGNVTFLNKPLSINLLQLI